MGIACNHSRPQQADAPWLVVLIEGWAVYNRQGTNIIRAFIYSMVPGFYWLCRLLGVVPQFERKAASCGSYLYRSGLPGELVGVRARVSLHKPQALLGPGHPPVQSLAVDVELFKLEPHPLQRRRPVLHPGAQDHPALTLGHHLTLQVLAIGRGSWAQIRLQKNEMANQVDLRL